MSKERSPGTRIDRRHKIAFAFILAVATLLLAEIGIRVTLALIVGPRVLSYGTETFREGRTIPSMVMKKVGYTPPTPDEPIGPYAKFKPHELTFDKDEQGERFSPTINSRGFRGSEFADAKEPGTVRVITLGTSSTFGYHDRDDETYPFYLEQRLNEASGGEQRFEVLNLGIPHIDSEQIYSLFYNEALPLQPDVVTLYTGYNDSGIGVNELMESRQDSSVLTSIYEAIRERSLFVASLDSLTYYAGLRPYYEEDFRKLLDGKDDFLIGNIERIRSACDEQGIIFIVANQQAKSRLIPREEIKGVTYMQEVALARQHMTEKGVPRRALTFLVHGELMTSLKEWATTNDVQFVDLLGALDDERDVLLTYVHLSARGNQIVADRLAGKIIEQVALRPAPTGSPAP